MSVDLYVCQACEQQATREVRVGRTGPTKGVRVVVRPSMPGPPEPSAATCELCSTALVLPDFERQLADANRRLDEAYAEIRRLNVDAQRVTLPPPGTVRVRIAVAVEANAEGVRWKSRGTSGPLAETIEDDARDALEASGPSHVVFVEADVPLPPEPATVKGRVAP